MNEQISKISQFLANTQMVNNLPSEHLQAVIEIAKLETYQKIFGKEKHVNYSYVYFWPTPPLLR